MGIGNQLLATITLWACAAYFAAAHKFHWIMSLPATFLTYICSCFFLIAPLEQGGLNLEPNIGYVSGAVVAAIVLTFFLIYAGRLRKEKILTA